MISISTRLEERKLKQIEKLAEKMNLNRGALIRKFILDGFQQAILEENIKLVKQGVLSIEQAAKDAEVSIYILLETARIMDVNVGLDDTTLKDELTSLEDTIGRNGKES
ncbi:MAG: hypothetical protein ACFFCS_02245 [Candidatus Hodarchaeota archaeon]